jgi:phage gp36-like protein
MGAYIVQSDVEDLFGVDNIAAWSDLSGAGSADSARITRAISYAEGIIDDSFRDGRYAIPFVPVPTIVKDWAAKLAGTWLFFCRPRYGKDTKAAEGFSQLREDVFEEMGTYQSGRRKLNVDKSTKSDVNSPQVC